MHSRATVLALTLVVSSALAPVSAQTATQKNAAAPTGAVSTTLSVPPGYVIGPDDVLSIVFWRDKEMSLDVVVRPDGNISLPLLNDIKAAGNTPDQLREQIVKSATKYIENPTATVVVKEIHSRTVFITGNVAKPNAYPLTTGMTVMQLIAVAGGLQEYADSGHIVIIRTAGGTTKHLRFNYKEVVKQKNVAQNVTLEPGDTVVVP